MKKEAPTHTDPRTGTFPSQTAARRSLEQQGYVPMNSGPFSPGVPGLQAEYFRLNSAPPSEREIASLRIAVYPTNRAKQK